MSIYGRAVLTPRAFDFNVNLWRNNFKHISDSRPIIISLILYAAKEHDLNQNETNKISLKPRDNNDKAALLTLHIQHTITHSFKQRINVATVFFTDMLAILN